MKSNLTYPRRKTLSARYLARFLLGETLKHREADNAAGSYRLAGFIHYLEKTHGWQIDRQEELDESLDPVGRKAAYTTYWLPESIIQQAGSDGQDYANRILGWEAKRIAERVAATTQPAEQNLSQIRSKKNSTNVVPINRTKCDATE